MSKTAARATLGFLLLGFTVFLTLTPMELTADGKHTVPAIFAIVLMVAVLAFCGFFIWAIIRLGEIAGWLEKR